MSANPRISIGGRPPPSIDLNTSYVLWAITTMATLLAGLGLIANLWIYIFNGIGGVYGWPVLYPDMNHARWLFASGLLSTIAAATFFLKSRIDDRSRSITTVRLPDRLIARTEGTDAVLDKFQCRARVEIDVYSESLARAIKEEPAKVTDVLQNGLRIAISDQITRFSKAKIEETLKLSLGECFDLLDVAGVTLLDLRQERVVEAPAPITEPPEADEETVSAAASAVEPVIVSAETPGVEIDTAPASADATAELVETQAS